MFPFDKIQRASLMVSQHRFRWWHCAVRQQAIKCTSNIVEQNFMSPYGVTRPLSVIQIYSARIICTQISGFIFTGHDSTHWWYHCEPKTKFQRNEVAPEIVIHNCIRGLFFVILDIFGILVLSDMCQHRMQILGTICAYSKVKVWKVCKLLQVYCENQALH